MKETPDRRGENRGPEQRRGKDGRVEDGCESAAAEGGRSEKNAAQHVPEYEIEDTDAPRERIVSAASHLFRRFGFRAVGVDLIAGESDVAKMTMYRYFDSKDDLIVEFLQREDRSLRSWLLDVSCDVDGPEAALTEFFRALETRTLDPACFGCPFQIAASEFPDGDHPAHREARKHKTWVREHLWEWVRQTGRRNVDETTEQLYLLVEGSWARARLRLVPPTHGHLVKAALLILEGGRFFEAVARSRPD